MSTVLGGNDIYEDNAASQASAPVSRQAMYQQDLMAQNRAYAQPQDVQEPKALRLPDDYVDDPHDISKPTWAREEYKSKLAGLSSGINLGSH